MKQFAFEGKLSGDGECMFLADIKEEDVILLMGQEEFDKEVQIELEVLEGAPFLGEATLEQAKRNVCRQAGYPGSILHHLGVEDDKRYRFVISVEEVGDG